MGIDAGLGLGAPGSMTTLTPIARGARVPMGARRPRPDSLLSGESVGNHLARRGFEGALSALWARLGDHLQNQLSKSLGDEVEDALADFDWQWWAPYLQTADITEMLAGGWAYGHAAGQQQTGQASAATTHQVGAAIHYGWKDPRAQAYARARGAEMVGMHLTPEGKWIPNPVAKWAISETTRQALRDLLVDMLTSGESRRDLKAKIEARPEFPGLFGEYRADMLARTELAMAANAGTTDAYHQAGIEHVYVHDNPTCPICKEYADTIQTLDWSRLNPVGHPHCIRAFSPVEADGDLSAFTKSDTPSTIMARGYGPPAWYQRAIHPAYIPHLH